MKTTRQSNSCNSSLHFHPHFHLSCLIAVLFTYFLTVCPSIISLDGDYVVDSSRLARSRDDPDDPHFYRECLDSKDCPINYCCTIGMQRYTKPFCSPLGKINDVCRPDNPGRNYSLGFPEAHFLSFIMLEVTNAYLPPCPCADGLECKRIGLGSCLPTEASADTADSDEDVNTDSSSAEDTKADSSAAENAKGDSSADSTETMN